MEVSQRWNYRGEDRGEEDHRTASTSGESVQGPNILLTTVKKKILF